MIYGIVVNTAKPESVAALAGVVSAMKSRKLEYFVQEDPSEADHAGSRDKVPYLPGSEMFKRVGMIVALGGDGTILSVARHAGPAGLPILGINLGRLGFLTEVSMEEIGPCLDDIAAGRFTIDERLALRGEAAGAAHSLSALNEIVIDRGDFPRVIEFETNVDGHRLAAFTADGLIVATPTGSTAYSLAAGGPIVTPASQVLTITPISAHTLTARPVIVPSGSTIAVAVRRGLSRVHVVADGQHEFFSQVPCEYTIRKAEYPVRLVKWKPESYYDLLRKKLLLGRGLRTGG